MTEDEADRELKSILDSMKGIDDDKRIQIVRALQGGVPASAILEARKQIEVLKV